MGVKECLIAAAESLWGSEAGMQLPVVSPLLIGLTLT